MVVATLSADSLALWIALRASTDADPRHAESVAAPAMPRLLPYRAVFTIRCASALPSLLTYSAGQGSIVYFLHRHYHVPVIAGATAVVLAAAAFLMVLALVAGVGLLGGAIPDRGEFRVLTWLALAALPVYMSLAAWKPRWLLRWRLSATLLSASPQIMLALASARGLHLTIMVSGHWLVLGLFGIEVPFAAALVQLPVMFLVGALPIAPAGLGTTQAAALTLFSGYASDHTTAAADASVLAYSLSCHVAGIALMAILGLVCLRRLQTNFTPSHNPCLPPSES